MGITIGEAAELMGLPVSTVRYYDKEGLVPSVARNSGGQREFTEQNVKALRVIQCLKHSGLQIPEIRQFMAWTQEGDATLARRRDLFRACRENVRQQMAELQAVLDTVEYKCWFYETAAELGSEEQVRAMPDDRIPEAVRAARL